MPRDWESIIVDYGGGLSVSDLEELGSLNTDSIRADQLEAMIIDIATYNSGNKGLFEILRRYFMTSDRFEYLVPAWLKSNRDRQSIRRFMQQDGRGYQERRVLIQESFRPLHEACELESRGASPDYSTDLFIGYESVSILWSKAQKRLATDPAGAITAARSMLESLFKHILDERSISYGAGDDAISLYRKVQTNIGLNPAEAQTEAIRQFMSGCASIVNGITSLRNAIGDAHGCGQYMPEVSPFFAELEVDMAGTLARFLVEYIRSTNNQRGNA